MGTRFLIVHNPAAGSRRATLVRHVAARLVKSGSTVDIHRSLSLTDCQRFVRAAVEDGAYDVIVAAGGDGTVRAVASVLIGTQVPLGIIPAGTGNVMAHEIGLRRNSRAVAECLLAARIAPVRTSFANGEPFFLMVGVGFDGRVVGFLDAGFKRRVGKLAYAWPIFRGVLAGPDKLCVRVGETEHAAAWTVASMGRRYAGSFMLAPNAHLDAASVQTVLFKSRGRLSMISQLFGVAAGRISYNRNIEHVPASAVEITSERPVPVQIDGDPFGSTPVRIETGGPVLNLIVPVRRRMFWRRQASQASYGIDPAEAIPAAPRGS